MSKTVYWLLIAVLFAGCAEGGAEGEPTSDVPADADDDAALLDAADGAATVHDGAPAVSDGGSQTDIGDLGDFGSPCTGNQDCASGWCVSSDQGPVCTVLCIDECPDPEWGCIGIKNTGNDLTFVCIPSSDALCQPCFSHTQCGDGFCVDLADGKACSRPCSTDAPCPTGFECETLPPEIDPTGAQAQCLPTSGGCTCSLENLGEERPCATENAYGQCFGAQTCLGSDGWGQCGAPEPFIETCDGVDNDCNGLADDSPAIPDADCFSTNEHGKCTGLWLCGGLAGWTCSAKPPAAESCNLDDDDCDGVVDNGFLDGDQYLHPEHCGGCNQPCAVPNAITACILENDTPTCIVESCNTGFYQAGGSCLPLSSSLCLPCLTDADCITPGDACLPLDEGAFCGRSCAADSIHGTECPQGYTCADQGPDSAPQCAPTGGSCDCVPQSAGVTKLCSVQNDSGTCFGQKTCGADSAWSPCDAPAPGEETCNGLDDDCDGSVDEESPQPAEPCQTTWTDPESGEISACSGAWTCSSGGQNPGWLCIAPTAGPEICDFADNDCDGGVDESFRLGGDGPYNALEHCGQCGVSCIGLIPNATAKCAVLDGDAAACVVDACAPGHVQVTQTACVPIQDPSCQACVTDQGCLLPGNVCVDIDGSTHCARGCGADNPYSDEGVCQDGFGCVETSPGQKHCLPTTESCSCLEPNDTGDQRACLQTNALGSCAGSQTCDAESGWSACSAPEPSLDICDGQDDDCDGQIDEDASAPPEPCEATNDSGTCSGQWSCQGEAGWNCTADEATDEVCDFVDNNCDGFIDNPFRDPVAEIYLHPLHCGTCNNSCVGAVPFASTTGCVYADNKPTCVALGCQDGYFLLSEGATPFCVPLTGGFTCSPCAADEHCTDLPDGQCTQLPADGAAFCTSSCTLPTDCDAGFSCTDGRCLPTSGSCSCLPKHAGQTRACFSINAEGSCFGAETCDLALGWVGCDATDPAAETCDGADNDCDGQIDEVLVHLPPTCSQSNEFGSCPGTFVCTGESGWECSAAAPTLELCDFQDNDCDGLVDEDFAAGTVPYVHDSNCGTCGVGCDGVLPNATAFCAANGGIPRCEVETCDPGFFPASATICLPAVDSLCQPCFFDATCQTPGDKCVKLEDGNFCGRDCGPDNLHGTPPGECPTGFECTQSGGGFQCEPLSASCSCLPDDVGATRPCSKTTVAGTCFGSQSCNPDEGWSICDAPTPVVEACDGQDNDCDGLVDEQVTHDPPECSVDNASGSCQGLFICDGDSGWLCTAATPGDETCDFKDNNCDGQVDEDWKIDGLYVHDDACGTCGVSCAQAIPNATAACSANNGEPRCEVSECAPGYYPASPLACLPAIEALCQPCSTDANCPTLGDQCLPLDGAAFCGRDCAQGNLHGLPAGQCPDGFSCTDQPDGSQQCVPSAGSCSCLPGDDGDTRPCSAANDNGTCFGTETCDPSQGWTGCTATPAGLEICDGADNDCDNFADEGVVHDPADCTNANEHGSCVAPWVCSGPDGWTCSAATPAAETCDLQDNDCDGAVDEDFLVDGLYISFDHCGTCGVSCADSIPNATAGCVANAGNPRCEVAGCEGGFFQASPLACLPVVPALCEPCATDANCPTPGDICLSGPDGGFCGRDCSADNVHGLPAGDCPAGFQCADQGAGVAQCVPVSGSCSCLPDNAGDVRSCSVENPDGLCLGVETCDPGAGWIGCTAQPAGAELCDGKDNDCDGFIDEQIAHDPPGCQTVNIFGTCPGAFVCVAPIGWLCNAPPALPESCDGQDNDCNGLVDDPWLVQGQYLHNDHCGACGNGCDGAIPNATAQCVLDGGSPACQVAACEPGFFQASALACLPVVDSLCSPCANDANCPTPGDQCVALDGSSFCARDCGPDTLHGAPGQCPDGFACADQPDGSQQCVPTSGSCACLPDDDGEVRSCATTSESGVCFGSQTCAPDTGWSACSAPAPIAELCNLADDDCNGDVDDVVGRGTACQDDNAFGTCPGIMDCPPSDTALVCTAKTPAAETCNASDDNCDGQIDEGFAVAGVYALDDHCGECGKSCTGLFTNGFGICSAAGADPECVLGGCDSGFVSLGGTQCVPAQLGSCEPCETAASCIIQGAACITLEDGDYCVNPCSQTSDCDTGFTCQDQGGSSFCVPDTNACQCDGSNTSLQKGCANTFTPDGGQTYQCFGLQTCQPAGWSTCVMPGEECNGLDDDCNGDSDEGFVDPDGRYTANEHCGACGNDCTLLVFPGGSGSCNAVVDPPICSLSCTGNCFDTNANPSDGCECCNPTPTDFPDVAGTDANCDGIDGEKGNAIFVSKEGDDANTGSITAPKLSIQAGIDAAASLGRRDVYVATGVYEEVISLAPAVNVYGGYASDFVQRNLVLYESAILSPPPTSLPGAVNATGITGGAVGSARFDGFSVFAADIVGTAASSYGVYLSDCDDSLAISNNRIHAGRGGDGGRGSDGVSGDDGASGNPGIAALDLFIDLGVDNHDCVPANHSPGGSGGTSACGVVDTSGGTGGLRICPAYNGSETAPPTAAEFGQSAADGVAAGGQAGHDAYHQAFQCLGFATFGPLEGGNGASGFDGTDGTPGAGCADALGSVTNGLWTPANATDGASGTNGAGAGGGGSGAGAWVHQSCDSKGFGRDNLGGSGGGGGGGACAGINGTAGSTGGGAFGLFAHFSVAPTGTPTVATNVLFGGIGGRGGDGGNGGTGGSGGAGGAGGTQGGAFDPPSPTYPSYEGGKGGKGGNGGHGGGGGGGCGGPAVGIFAAGQATIDLSVWATTNSFTGPGLAGSGGLGGFSLGAPGTTGNNGSTNPTNL